MKARLAPPKAEVVRSNRIGSANCPVLGSKLILPLYCRPRYQGRIAGSYSSMRSVTFISGSIP
jgi:hypothetical protein